MGDVRFEEPLRLFQEARRRGVLDRLSPETGVQALAALAAEADPMAANVLATRLLNQMRRSATLLRYVADGVVYLDHQGRVLFANPAAEELLGVEAGALLGHDFHDLTRHRRKGDAHALNRERCEILAALDDPDNVARVSDGDVFERSDGTSFLVGFVVAPVVEQGEQMGVAVVFRDITQQMEREGKLALARAALESTPVPVFWLDRDGDFLYTNPAAAAHLGHPPEALARMTVYDVDPGFDREGWDRTWEEVKRSGSAELDVHHLRADGSLVPVHLRVHHVAHAGREFHVAIALPGPPTRP